jgi:hypothetical protein
MKKTITYILILFFLLYLWYFVTVNDFYNDSEPEIWWITDITSQIKNVESEFNIIDKILNIYIEEEVEIIEKNIDSHIKTPDNIKSLYYSANAINNEDKLNNFFEIAKNKEINSIMIDLKEVDWYISIALDDKYFTKIKPVSNNKIKNICDLLNKLHENWIYTIARIAVFKDKRLAEFRPDLSIKWLSNWKTWEDFNWNKYTDQYSKEVWDYHVELWIAAYELWFDEINYDYVRFPTDWYISQAYYPFANEIISKDLKWGKVKVIDSFSNYLTTKLREYNSNIVISADVFWLVTDYTMFGIWQNLESFLLSFDFVWPMIYPSHYWEGYYWYKYPDNNPYNIINIALNNALEKINNLNIEIENSVIENRDIKYNELFKYSKVELGDREITINNIRPYLQWFSCTRCNNYTLYDREKFATAVKWVTDIWIDSWWVWSSWWNYHDERFETVNKKDEN